MHILYYLFFCILVYELNRFHGKRTFSNKKRVKNHGFIQFLEEDAKNVVLTVVTGKQQNPRCTLNIALAVELFTSNRLREIVV